MENELRRLLGLVEEWGPKGEIPAIERDLALDKLKALYEELRFARGFEPAAAAEPVREPAAEEQPLEIIDLDEMLSAEPMSMAEPMAEPEPAAEPAFEPEPAREPEPVAAPDPAAVESEPAFEPVVEPVVEPVPAVGPEPVAMPESEPVAASEPAAAPEPAPRVQESLFGLEEMPPVHRRESRRVLMSLYGDNPSPRASRSHRAEHREEAAEAAFELPVEEAAARGPEPVRGPAPVAVPEPAFAEPAPACEPEPAYEDSLAEAVRSVAPNPGPEPQAILSDTDVVSAENGQENSVSAQPSIEAEEPAETGAAEDEAEVGEPAFREIPVAAVPLSEAGAAGEQPVPVLGETLHSEVRTVADALAAQREGASALAGNIESLRSAIGINDRFLLIGELFGGDAARYEEALDELDARESLDDCMIYIAENYAWNPNSGGAKLLFDLLERKFGEY